MRSSNDPPPAAGGVPRLPRAACREAVSQHQAHEKGRGLPMRREASMEFVRQRTDNDCGVAALAMLLGTTYDDVVPAWRKALDADPRASTYSDLIAVAAEMGVTLQRSRRPEGRCIRRVRPEPYARHSHWVAMDGEWLYCPTNGIYYHEHYPWQSWGHGLELDKSRVETTRFPG